MKKINRRKFIVNTAEATAGAALAFTILEGSASGTSLNGTIRVAVVGVNGRGKDHLKGFAPLKDVQVAAICDVDENVNICDWALPVCGVIVTVIVPTPIARIDTSRILSRRSSVAHSG